MADDESQNIELEVPETEEFKAQKKENWKTYVRISEKTMDKAIEKQEYAMKQFDTLIVALSTAGLGFVSNYIKDLKGDLFWARSSQILFVSSLLVMLIAHLVSMRANNVGHKTKAKQFAVDSFGEEHISGFNQKEYDEFQRKGRRKIKRLNRTVITLNTIAFVSLFSAIGSFVYFTFIS
jgi:uncharacterized membrane protein